MAESNKGVALRLKTTLSDGTQLESNEFIIPAGDQGVGVASMELVYSGTAPSPTRFEIGDLFFSSNSTSPAIRFGGTWEQIKDRFILAAGDTYAAGTTGGEATHTLTVDELATHSHAYLRRMSPTSFGNWAIAFSNGTGSEDFSYTETTGENQPHNNMPPYHVAYVWRKISN